ncbi:MAG: sn-glycerol-3-phosphate ABC transporter ATP-binding protein UgpC [Limimaricola sp.]|uniref:ABC transporter ATP-binding protein n=1 Tax=Limimaricola sp. TaxID=2211665 RepID=UPI001E15D675|nr:sn-glycerol-3-phosphate ABC transporter ATP-binding protein UgpC [Limimaricola sp.]MBI1416765.1 sn-glycerol-3-phosphate ABC transporter ATP-binding protein UgpC [Limimaricola sp.]
MAEIVLNKLVKNYGRTRAVHGIDLSIAHQEFVVLVGPSGCGKSTTLRMIAGLEEISDGTVSIGGAVVNELPPRKRNISMVFQNYALYPHMNVRENLGFGLKIAGQPAADIAQRVDEAAEILGLTELLERTPAELSGGQRQRVAMGRAIVRKPAAFLFDEPLSNLDAKLRGQMRAEIKKLHQSVRTTVVYVTHDQIEAMTLADRIVVMRAGRIEQVGTPMEVYNHPTSAFVATFIGSPPMNMLPGTISGGAVRLADGSALPVPERAADNAREGQEVLLGIRPDDISPVGHGLSQDGPGAELTLTVAIAEPLGMESLIFTRIAGQEVQAKLYGPRMVLPGEELVFRLALDRAHLFDAASGASLEAR